MSISHLQPESLWSYFSQLNAIPRASKKEEAVLQWLKSFAEEHQLRYAQDAIGNLVIYKSGTQGKEDNPAVVLQGHVDMVHQKNADTSFDFDTMGIQMHIDGDWVRARGTTLGADNGIAVATMLALLASTDIAHPPIEALFTVDEEAGMTGAMNLDGSLLSGKLMLNMDTEEDDEFTIGSAGGVDTTTELAFDTASLPNSGQVWKLGLRGLQGGHSGMEIHLGLGNANILLAQLLLELNASMRLISFDGGSLRNAIPREAVAEIWTASEDDNQWKKLREAAEELKKVYSVTDPRMDFFIEKIEVKKMVQSANETQSIRILQSIAGCPNGIFRMSSAAPGLVETSSNLARIELSDGLFRTLSLQRSSIDSSRDLAGKAVGASFAAIGAKVVHTGHYPGWQPATNSKIVDLMHATYSAHFGESPRVTICHAGLECGIIGERCPGMEMISYGPTIKGAHSPDERVSISSVQKFWHLTLETLRQL